MRGTSILWPVADAVWARVCGMVGKTTKVKTPIDMAHWLTGFAQRCAADWHEFPQLPPKGGLP